MAACCRRYICHALVTLRCKQWRAGKGLEVMQEQTSWYMLCDSASAGCMYLEHMPVAVPVGDFQGELQMWDLERMDKPVFHAQAHASIINQLDATGGQVGLFDHLLCSGHLLELTLT